MGLSNSSVLIAIKKARAIAQERRSNPMYELFFTDLDKSYAELKDTLKQARCSEINWHAEVDTSNGLFTKARTTYIKYRELIVEVIPGAGLVDWEYSSVSPSEIEIAIEKCIDVIESNTSILPFAAPALEELHSIADEIDKEITVNRQYYRVYGQAVQRKDEVLASALALFYRVRRFIRRDLGNDSPEYSQLKDRAVAAAAKDEEKTPVEPPKVAEVQTAGA